MNRHYSTSIGDQFSIKLSLSEFFDLVTNQIYCPLMTRTTRNLVLSFPCYVLSSLISRVTVVNFEFLGHAGILDLCISPT